MLDSLDPETMLEASPKNFFSTNYIIRVPGRTPAVLDVSLWRESAEIELDGAVHRFYREKIFGGAFVLERAGVVIARAVKPSAFRSRFDVELGGKRFVVRKVSMWRRRFGVFSGEQQIGVVRPAGVFTRRALIEMPSDWSLAHEVFIFWLVLIIWRREAAAAAS